MPSGQVDVESYMGKREPAQQVRGDCVGQGRADIHAAASTPKQAPGRIYGAGSRSEPQHDQPTRCPGDEGDGREDDEETLVSFPVPRPYQPVGPDETSRKRHIKLMRDRFEALLATLDPKGADERAQLEAVTNFILTFELDPMLNAEIRCAVGQAVSQWRTLSRDRRLSHFRSLAIVAAIFQPTDAEGIPFDYVDDMRQWFQEEASACLKSFGGLADSVESAFALNKMARSLEASGASSLDVTPKDSDKPKPTLGEVKKSNRVVNDALDRALKGCTRVGQASKLVSSVITDTRYATLVELEVSLRRQKLDIDHREREILRKEEAIAKRESALEVKDNAAYRLTSATQIEMGKPWRASEQSQRG